MTSSTINCRAALGLLREGDAMAGGVGTVFPLLVAAGSPSARLLAVLCICVPNPGESKKLSGGDQKWFGVFFFLYRTCLLLFSL